MMAIIASTLAHIAAVAAGLAICASPFVFLRKGLLHGLVSAVALGTVAALLITIARAIA
jgi:hypothetical protein